MYPGYEFSLQRTALFSIARTIWQHPRVSVEVKSWFDVYSYPPFGPMGEWHKLLGDLLKRIREQLSLPAHLEIELAHVIKEMGLELLRWLEHVKRMNKEYYQLLSHSYWETLDCPKNIHWTRHGTIDVPRTVEASWVANPRPRNMCGTYHMAVRSGIPEDKVHRIWNAMSELQQWAYRGIFNEDYAVNAYYEAHREGKLDELQREIAENRGGSAFRRLVGWDDRVSFEENLFLIFVSEGYPEAAKMLWARLDDLAGERAIEDGATVAFERWRQPVRNYDDFMRSQWADLSVYLASRLTDAQRTQMLHGKASDWLRMMAVTWPWREFFVQQLSTADLAEDGYCDRILYDIAQRLIGEDAEAGYVVEGSKNQQLLQHCWRRLPREAKLACQTKLIMAVMTLIRARDMNSAQMILSSPEVAAKKPLMVKFAHSSFEDMMVNGEFEILERFIDANFETDREKRNFKMSLLPHTTFILRGRFDLAEKCLDWQCRTEREKMSVKMAIDFRPIGEDPCRWKNTARRFLDWQCASLEKQRNTKSSSLNCKFAKDLIYKLWIRWKTKMPGEEDDAHEFFDWYLKLELEIVLFTVRRNVCDELVALLVEAMLKHNYVDIVDNLKCWCSMTDREVKEVRRKILDSAKVPICRHYIEEGQIQVSRGLLEWFEDDAQKKSFVNHFVANKGSTSCYVFIASDRSVPSQKKSKFRNFLDTWIKPLDEAQLKKFKSGVSFQAKKTKYKQPKDCKNYEVFQSLLSEMT